MDNKTWKGFLTEGKNLVKERSEEYELLDNLMNDLSRIKGVEDVGGSDIDSWHRANVQVQLKPTHKLSGPRSKEYAADFVNDLKSVKREIKKICDKNNVKIISYNPPKKIGWKSHFGEKQSGYKDDVVDMEVEFSKMLNPNWR